VTRLRDAGVPAVSKLMLGHIDGSLLLSDWAPARQWRALRRPPGPRTMVVRHADRSPRLSGREAALMSGCEVKRLPEGSHALGRAGRWKKLHRRRLRPRAVAHVERISDTPKHSGAVDITRSVSRKHSYRNAKAHRQQIWCHATRTRPSPAQPSGYRIRYEHEKSAP
jgi:hypothetical protein